MHPASYWVKRNEEKSEIQCLLCPHNCVLLPDENGLCRARKNIAGSLVSKNYGCVTALNLDPIEKKPLKRYMPGRMVLSLGTFGCNLECGYCQNWSIAHGQAPPYQILSPRQAVEKALELVPYDNIGIAYTYSEPLVWYEFVLETAKLVREAGLKNVLVTNGYINPKPLKELLPYIDAVNLDIKAFTEEFYHEVCSGKLGPVLKAAELFAQSCHLEITTLLVPSKNSGVEEIKALAEWIADIDRGIPLHLTRYFPRYKMTIPPTDKETMQAARRVAAESLTDVILGNV